MNPHLQIDEEVEKSPYWKKKIRQKGNWLPKIFGNASAYIKCSDKQQGIIELLQQSILSLEADSTARIDKVTLVAVHRKK